MLLPSRQLSKTQAVADVFHGVADGVPGLLVVHLKASGLARSALNRIWKYPVPRATLASMILIFIGNLQQNPSNWLGALFSNQGSHLTSKLPLNASSYSYSLPRLEIHGDKFHTDPPAAF